MSPIDLRIKYRQETGLYPTALDKNDTFDYTSPTDYTGKLTQAYGRWLEKNSNQREEYQRSTGCVGSHMNKRRVTKYTQAYRVWLEEEKCKTFN